MAALFRIFPFIHRRVLGAVLVLVSGLLSAATLAAEGIDPEADKILRSMSAYLGGLSAFSMNADIDNEIVDLDGQKLQFSSTSQFVIARPAKFHVHRKGAFADAELFLMARP